MKTLPADVLHYKSPPEFTEATIPPGLLRAHHTAAGVWGRITILEGRLRYRIGAEELLLTPQRHGVVEPEVRHEVEALGRLRLTAVAGPAGCDGLVFMPLALPKAISASDDPVLAARGAAYAVSLARRSRQAAAAPAFLDER
jgi:tellurite resistance-related uncharacterized protein